MELGYWYLGISAAFRIRLKNDKIMIFVYGCGMYHWSLYINSNILKIDLRSRYEQCFTREVNEIAVIKLYIKLAIIVKNIRVI